MTPSRNSGVENRLIVDCMSPGHALFNQNTYFKDLVMSHLTFCKVVQKEQFPLKIIRESPVYNGFPFFCTLYVAKWSPCNIFNLEL